MADITKVALVKNDGVAVTFAAANAGGDSIAAFTERDELIVKNASGGNITVTIASHENCNFGSDHDLAKVVPNNGEYHFRLSPVTRWANPSTLKLDISYSGVSSVTVACLTHPF